MTMMFASPKPASGGGTVDSIVAGSGISVNDTDPANPIVSATGGGGGIESVVAGSGISVDDTDPANPIVSTNTTDSGWLDLADLGYENGWSDSSPPAQYRTIGNQVFWRGTIIGGSSTGQRINTTALGADYLPPANMALSMVESGFAGNAGLYIQTNGAIAAYFSAAAAIYLSSSYLTD